MRFVIFGLLGFAVGSFGGGLAGYYGSEFLSWLELIDRVCMEGSCTFGSRMNAGLSLIAGAALGLSSGLSYAWLNCRRQARLWLTALLLLANLFASGPSVAETAGDPGERLVKAARAQVGVTLTYNPAYVRLSYPGGDVSPEQGVCTDVIVRAYRAALNLDLQKLVHEDMKSSFASYPKQWGLKRPDTNIDHRRVPNLQMFFQRKGASLPVTTSPADYRPGDLVTQMLPGNLPHIAIVSDRRSSDGARPLVIHNIGAGTREEDSLFAFPVTGHYRFVPTSP